ncbi:hypothetical protein H4219_004895 [Mycoemilia scoparia]|uniref:protein-L-isoaspartate(D-aspartate) O-methyltransferase n=1 Tax=Mycoemilia scoparia TaxID=417184 RepID=A0A9W7ZVZ6_9FUNG|nr:hypothetical protein H4219_004895 [Mycoemilia scoparia]
MLLCFKGSTNSELVGNLQRYSIIESHRVAAAMEKVDRGDFVSENPYQDSPQYIGYGATISAPHMHAYALEHLKDCLNPGSKGCGSGLTVGIDHMKGLTDLSVRNIRKNHADLLESGRIKIVLGDGREGYPSEAPYDCM